MTPFSYLVDDWLVIRTDAAGHQACVVTEMWPEWGVVGVRDTSDAYRRAAQARVLAKALTLPEAVWQGMSCHNGWCGLCGIG